MTQQIEIFSFAEEKSIFKCFPKSICRDFDADSSLATRLDQHIHRLDHLAFMCALLAEPRETFSPDHRQVESQESDDVKKLLTQKSFVKSQKRRVDDLEPAAAQNPALKY